MTNLTRFPFSVYRLDDLQAPPDVAAAIAEAVPETPLVRVLNEQIVAGYVVFPDLFGQPVMVARVQQPRTIYA